MAIPFGLLQAASITVGATTRTLWPSSTGGIWLTSLDLGFPEIHEAVVPRVTANGERDYTQFYGASVVAITFRVAATNGVSAATYLDTIRSWMNPLNRPVIKYTLVGQTERQVTLRPSSYSGSMAMQVLRTGTLEVQLQFKNPDGRSFATTQSSVTVIPNDSMGGRSYPLTFNRSYVTVAPPYWNVTGGGNTDAFPIINLYGALQGPGISNDTTGQTLEFENLTIDSGDFVEINTNTKTVRKNGSTLPADNLRSFLTTAEWWTIQPGLNTFRLSSNSYYGAPSATISWFPAWL